jgi:acetylornithine deacetylase/succinyl-diaminopimelate desuccinylase-like protein
VALTGNVVAKLRHGNLVVEAAIVMHTRYFAVLSCFAALALPCAAARAQENAITPPLIQKHVQGNIQEFFDLLALPNDAVNAEDIRKNAAYLEAAFRKRAFATAQLANNGKPLVFAEFGGKAPGAKTILFYMHFDGQPVAPEQWAQKSPWTATLKVRDDSGKWRDIDREKLKTGVLDPDARLFARSASDDKGPIAMFLDAFDILAAVGLAPAMNVKVLLDSEEEKGSPNMVAVARANRELLNADALVINDGPLHESGERTIMFGNRGNASARLTV